MLRIRVTDDVTLVENSIVCINFQLFCIRTPYISSDTQCNGKLALKSENICTKLDDLSPRVRIQRHNLEGNSPDTLEF